MSRQHTTPYLLNDDKVYALQPANRVFDEGWLQKFVFTHYQAIPLGEIEPAFGALIPVCRELPTHAGPIDLFFINNDGLPTLVECKLWKNPEARREVIGQILDYAKEISQWSYEDLQNAIYRSQDAPQVPLSQLVLKNTEEIDENAERDFIDNVYRNLRRGRFLLLIIGDGIRENVEQITSFLNDYANLNFSLALVEFGIFQFPDQDNKYIIQPRIIAQTAVIERVVFRIEDNKIVSAPLREKQLFDQPKKTKISEDIFWEKIEENVGLDLKVKLESFIKTAEDLGLYVEPGKNSLKLKSELLDINFGVFRTSGTFFTVGIAETTENLGYPQIGEEYLTELAKLLINGYVKHSDNHFWTTIRIKKNNENREATLSEMMEIQKQWLELIQRTLNKISEHVDQ